MLLTSNSLTEILVGLNFQNLITDIKKKINKFRHNFRQPVT